MVGYNAAYAKIFRIAGSCGISPHLWMAEGNGGALSSWAQAFHRGRWKNICPWLSLWRTLKRLRSGRRRDGRGLRKPEERVSCSTC
jgi:hypothetical protein